MPGMIARVLSFMETPRVVRQHTELSLWIFNLYGPLKRSYNKEYGSKRDRAEVSPVQELNIRASQTNEQQSESQGAMEPGAGGQPKSINKGCPSTSEMELEENDELLRYNKYLDAYKCFTTAYMAYIVFKYLANRLNFGKLLKLNRPLHCYLIGRSAESEVFGNTLTFIIACAWLSWRTSSKIEKGPYKLSGTAFVLMEQQEIDQFYERIYRGYDVHHPYNSSDSSKQLCPSIEFNLDEFVQLRRRERFILDTMCLRDVTAEQITFKLRPNRTPQSRSKLLRFMGRAHLLASLHVLGIICLATPYGLAISASERRYMSVYPDCDPLLKQLDRTGMPTLEHSKTLTWHRTLTILFDFIENSVITIDGSMLCLYGVASIFEFTHDLIVYWRQIHEKIAKLVASERLDRFRNVAMQQPEPRTQIQRSHHVPTTFHFERKLFQRATREVQVEILDFFHQVRTVDVLLTNALSIIITGWLTLAALFTYISIVETIKTLPVDMIVVLAFIIYALTLSSCCSLVLQHQCNRSYSSICALMALDRTGSWQGFMTIVDLFTRRSACFTLFHNYPFQSTTFLKLFGYTFSAFFLVASLLRV